MGSSVNTSNQADGLDSLKPAVLIFGGGQQGMAIARWFGSERRNVLIVTDNADELADLETLGYQAELIEDTDDDALVRIGVGQWVETIFCMFPDDSLNVFVTLSARSLSSTVRILCIADTTGSGQKLLAAGATKVIDPYEITGSRITELIRRPLMVQTLEHTLLGKANLDLAEMRITKNSAIHGKRLSEIDLQSYNLILLGLVDKELGNQLVFNTTGQDHSLDSGDYLVVIGPFEEIDAFRTTLVD